MSIVRRALDWLYLAGGIVGAFFLVCILVIICLQMLARWTGIPFPGSTNYAGYCMAASTFFALAHALNRGAHIRVTIILRQLGAFRRLGEIWCYVIAAGTMSFFAFHAFERNLQTRDFNFISQGLDATPLWIPEIAMTAGSALLALALWDHLFRMIFTDHTGVEQPDLTERHG